MWRRKRRREVIHEGALLSWKRIADGALTAGGYRDDDVQAPLLKASGKVAHKSAGKDIVAIPADNKPLFDFSPARSRVQSARKVFNSLLLA